MQQFFAEKCSINSVLFDFNFSSPLMNNLEKFKHRGKAKIIRTIFIGNRRNYERC